MKTLNYEKIFNSEKVLIYIIIILITLKFLRENFQIDLLAHVTIGLLVGYMLHFFHKKKEYNFVTIFTAVSLIVLTILSVELYIVSSEKSAWEAIQHISQNKDTLP